MNEEGHFNIDNLLAFTEATRVKHPLPELPPVKAPKAKKVKVSYEYKNAIDTTKNILVDGVKVGELTTSRYDQHHRRSVGGSGGVARFSFKGKRFDISDANLRDLKARIKSEIEALAE